ncbi:MAG: YceI family protein [Bacteroidales bacterium]|nr:YceI family protein [Bacteroidales bacterium]MDT8430125.1 YceI family protein [Bacteroidales bacterium]
MKKSILLSIAAALFISVAGFGQSGSKLVSTKTQITFFSSTPAEDIQAQNTAAVSTIDKSSGEVVFSVPMQGFEFEKSLMQKHFNSDNFLDTQTFPDAKLKAKITNPESIDFGKDGSYPATVKGELTIKGKTNPINESGTVTVKGNTVKVDSKFDVTLSDYGITFAKGKPSTNIAKTVEVTVQAEYK